MIKHIKMTFVLIFFLISTPLLAQSVSMKLAPKGSKILTNHYFWTLNAQCTIQGGSKNKILVKALKSKSVINGRNLTDGQTAAFTVYNNDSFHVSAEAGAQVDLENLGNEQVQALCVS